MRESSWSATARSLSAPSPPRSARVAWPNGSPSASWRLQPGRSEVFMVGLPAPRGPVSELLRHTLAHAPHALGAPRLPAWPDPLFEEDPRRQEAVAPDEIDLALREIAGHEGPPLSAYLRSSATLEQAREFLVHRSAYQLKEADPHSWAIPRLFGPPKAALIEIQADEYGGGRAEWMHCELFARAMRAVGLDAGYNAYLELIPAPTLATVNLMSLFGLHRRLRGAIVGHLAVFEMTSSIPNRRYGDALRRLGFDGEATLFFDEHVAADAVHENVAAVDLAGGLVRQDRALAGDVLWGARALSRIDERFARHVLDRWRAGRTSLRRPLSAVGGPEVDELMGAVAERLDP